VSSELESLRRKVNDLSSLLDATTAIAQDMRLNAVLARVVQQSVAVTSSEAGTLWLADEQQNLAPVVIIGGANREQLSKMRLAPGEGVAGRVFGTGQPLLIADVHGHPRWASRFDDATGYQTRSVICTPLTARGRRLGAVQLINKAGGGFFSEDDLFLLAALSGQASLVIDSCLLLQQAHTLTNSLIEVFTGALDDRDPYSHGHSMRVAEYSLVLGRLLGLSADDLEKLRRAALLHNIGQVGVPDAVLKKATALSPDEEAQFRAHTSLGAEILSRIKPGTAMAEAVLAARHHHERADGAGYPDTLIGEQASLFARIIAVADCFYELTTDKPPRKSHSFDEAIAEIRRLAATKLDANLATAFADAIEKARHTA